MLSPISSRLSRKNLPLVKSSAINYCIFLGLPRGFGKCNISLLSESHKTSSSVHLFWGLPLLLQVAKNSFLFKSSDCYVSDWFSFYSTSPSANWGFAWDSTSFLSILMRHQIWIKPLPNKGTPILWYEAPSGWAATVRYYKQSKECYLTWAKTKKQMYTKETE